jgi:3-oxoadipate enol-lactonase
MRREQITIGRKQISYLISEAPAPAAPRQAPRTAVFLHAFPLNAEMWRAQLAAAPAGWRMIAPDYRGFGQCPAFEMAAARMNDLAGDVIDLLDHLEIAQVVVVGCSMGGYVAFELLASAPSHVSGLVLVDTRAGADTDEGKAGRRKMLEMVDTGGSAAVADQMTPKLLGATTQRQQPDLVKQVHRMITAANPAAIRMAITAMMERKDMTPLLPGIAVPTLVVAGAEDTLIPPAAIDDLHNSITRSGLATIELAGHLPSLEQPAAFDAALSRFLKAF